MPKKKNHSKGQTKIENVFAERPQTKVFSSLIGFLLFTAVLLTTVQTLATMPSYYMWRFDALEVSKTTNLSDDNLKQAAIGISDYLSTKSPDFKAALVKDGTTVDGFNAREKAHMADVLKLFKGVDLIRLIALGGILLFFLLRTAFGMSRTKIYWPPITKAALVSTIVFSVVLGLLSLVDFTTWFVRFHELLFTNDMWQLDPATSLLINLLPEPFFVGFVFHTLAITFGVTGIIFGLTHRNQEVRV